jgi:hypothetical protein
MANANMQRVSVKAITARSSKSFLVEVEEGNFLLIEVADEEKQQLPGLTVEAAPALAQAPAQAPALAPAQAPARKSRKPRYTEAEKAAWKKDQEDNWSFVVEISECIGKGRYTTRKGKVIEVAVHKEEGNKYRLLYLSQCGLFGGAEEGFGWLADKGRVQLA